MSKNQRKPNDGMINQQKFNLGIPPNLKIKDQFKTVGTVRMSKSRRSISVKLIAENRFIHISKRDIELILSDESNRTVGNVIEYEVKEMI